MTLDLCDTLAIDVHPQPGVIHLTCSDPTLETDGRNLVVRAASDLLLSLAEGHAMRRAGLSIHLSKRIPTGGGLGGGSADAAYTLMGVNELLGLGVEGGRLAELAGGLGSDVAFFLAGPSALCTGRGEVVQRLGGGRLTMAALLALPGTGMPTPAVYREFDRLGLGSVLPPAGEELARYEAMAGLPAEELLPRLVNDLEAPAFALSRELAELRGKLERAFGRPVRMSGSGSTLFTLFDNISEADLAAKRFPSEDGVRLLAVKLCPVHHRVE